MRVVHVPPNASSIYVKLNSIQNLPHSYITLSYKGVSNYVEFPAGPIDLVIYQAGTTGTLKFGRMNLDGLEFVLHI